MNESLFFLINGMANQNIVFDAIMIMISKCLPYVYILIMVYLYWQGIRKKRPVLREQTFAAGVLVLLCAFASFIVGSIYYENRPFVDHQVNLIVAHAADASFPSDHAVGTMAIACGILYYKWNLGMKLVYGSILMGFSRVFVGNHYPGDILGAFLLVALVTAFYNKKLRSSVVSLYRFFESLVGLDKLNNTGKKIKSLDAHK